MRKLIILGLLLFLTGCATAAQQKGTLIRTTIQSAANEVKGCSVKIRSEPEYSSLLPHLPPIENHGIPTMAQMADDAYPTKQEIGLLIKMHDEAYTCKLPALDKVSGISPDLGLVLADEEVDSSKLFLRLVKRKMTWGEASQKQKSLIEKYKIRLIAATKEINRELGAEHRQELAQRQQASEAFSNALMQWSQQQQMINALSRPVVTNCTGMGNMVNCVTQ